MLGLVVTVTAVSDAAAATQALITLNVDLRNSPRIHSRRRTVSSVRTDKGTPDRLDAILAPLVKQKQ